VVIVTTVAWTVDPQDEVRSFVGQGLPCPQWRSKRAPTFRLPRRRESRLDPDQRPGDAGLDSSTQLTLTKIRDRTYESNTASAQPANRFPIVRYVVIMLRTIDAQ
jgi:hypothetical protein